MWGGGGGEREEGAAEGGGMGGNPCIQYTHLSLLLLRFALL